MKSDYETKDDASKPSVTVVGLKGNQAEAVKSSFGDRLDLNFVKDCPHKQLKATAESSDFVVVMTRFMDHGMFKHLRDHEGLTYCNGGMSSLNLTLHEILNRS